MLTATGSHVDNLLRTATAGRWQKGAQNFLGVWDDQLYCPTEAQLTAFSEPFRASYGGLTNKGEAFDCEDFSFAFAGITRAEGAKRLDPGHSIACGLIMGTFGWVSDFNERHVCCWALLDESGQEALTLIEPQRSPASPKGWRFPLSQALNIRLILV